MPPKMCRIITIKIRIFLTDFLVNLYNGLQMKTQKMVDLQVGFKSGGPARLSYHRSRHFICTYKPRANEKEENVMIAKGFTEPTARIKALKAEVVNAVPEVKPSEPF